MTAVHGAVVMHVGRRTGMHVPVLMTVPVGVFMPLLLTVQVHMNLHPLNAVTFFWLTQERELVINVELCQFCLEIIGADPKINQGGQIHVAADSGKTIVIQYLHKAPARGVRLKKRGADCAARAQYRYFARNRE